jgi:hypothetical protein
MDTPRAADKAGVFNSDVHRRVLAHLAPHDEDFGWTPVALLHRLAEDRHTPIPPRSTEHGFLDYETGLAELEAVLDELGEDGFAETPDPGVWRMTLEGFKTLTGPIANEPDPAAAVEGPAFIDLGPTPIVGQGAITAAPTPEHPEQ